MKWKNSIESRVSIGLLVCGAVTAFGLGAVAVYLNDQLEESILAVTIESESELVAKLAAAEPEQTQFLDRGVIGYFVPHGANAAEIVPSWILSSAINGEEAIQHQSVIYDTARREVATGTVYLAIDVTDVEASERRFVQAMLACSVLFALLTWAAGRFAARRIINPLVRLADQIDALEPGVSDSQLVMLDQDEAINTITKTFNAYLNEMDAFVLRERHLSAMASHELRTPLSVIGGAVDVLLDRERQQPQNLKTLQRIKDSVGEMAESIDALLLLARSSRASPADQPVCSVDQIARRVAELHRPRVGLKNIDVSCENLSTLDVKANPRLIEIMVSNLVDNAIKYTESGVVEVSVIEHALSVSDSGVGMDPTQLARLLLPGQRGKTAVETGAGFGLYIVSEICERFGWRLDFSEGRHGGVQVTVVFGE